MVWRESSWAAHYQSPLPASDTLFTEALGPDSPGRRQQTQGTALPSPHPLALALFGFANSWALNGLQCLLDQLEWTQLGGYPPSHLFMPSTPKSPAKWGGSFEIPFSPPAPEALGLGREALGPGASLQSLTCPWCKRQAGGHWDRQGLFSSSFPPCRLHSLGLRGRSGQ